MRKNHSVSQDISSRVQIHDKHQFEVKLDYSLSASERESCYRVEAYLFVPKSLGAHLTTYSRDQFYSDLHTYIRFKTPSLPLEVLLQAQGASPLLRLEDMVKKVKPESISEKDAFRMSYDARLLASMVRAEVRDRVLRVSYLFNTVKHVQTEEVMGAWRSLMGQMQELLQRMRNVYGFLEQVPKHLGLAHVGAYVDEYLSLTCEYHTTFLLDGVSAYTDEVQDLKEVRQKTVDFVLMEQNYRKQRGYKSVLTPGVENDHFVYRRGKLKKFVSSVLFLDTHRERELLGVSAVIAALAAGVAMLVATLAAIFSQQKWGLNTAPFVFALVLSYIVKDRLKDGIKTYVSGKFTHWLWDYNVHITDPDQHVTFGRCRESVSFMSKPLVPKDVLKVRHGGAMNHMEATAKPEVVIKYTKDIRLNGSNIRKWHYDLHDINDLLRFNLSHFLVRADDPMQIVRHYDAGSDEVKEILCPKLYHLNVVLMLKPQKPEKEARWVRVRVILDRHGIRELQEINDALC
jgi:hypothetical protein